MQLVLSKTKQNSLSLTVQSSGGFGLAGTGTYKNPFSEISCMFYWTYVADTPYLSLSNLRDIIEVGRGPYVGEDIIMHWNSTGADYTHDVSALAFTTFLIDGAWKFSPIPGSFGFI